MAEQTISEAIESCLTKLLKPLHDKLDKLQKDIERLQKDVDVLVYQVRSKWH